jgi:hypothetical protein
MLAPSTYWDNYPRDPGVTQAIERTNFNSLCDVASTLRGKQCTIDKNKCAYGGVNIVYQVDFDECEFWIARVRRSYPHYPSDGEDKALESEVATMRFIQANTTIPLPTVYSSDARFGPENSVGFPYILMEAMPGRRLYGGNRADVIPDDYKPKVYKQIAEFILQLYQLPFHKIGMLFPDTSNSGVRLGAIHDQRFRIPPYGPFTNSLDFYQMRWELLHKYYQRRDENHAPSGFVADESMPQALASIVAARTANGPYRLAHPDFQINNFLFDHDFTITALVDWSGCQTLPLESFARHPIKIIPYADRFLRYLGDLLSPEIRTEWMKRREMFLRIFKECQTEVRDNQDDLLYNMMLSSRAYYATCLDFDGILGIRRRLPATEFAEFVKEGAFIN